MITDTDYEELVEETPLDKAMFFMRDALNTRAKALKKATYTEGDTQRLWLAAAEEAQADVVLYTAAAQVEALAAIYQALLAGKNVGDGYVRREASE